MATRKVKHGRRPTEGPRASNGSNASAPALNNAHEHVGHIFPPPVQHRSPGAEVYTHSSDGNWTSMPCDNPIVAHPAVPEAAGHIPSYSEAYGAAQNPYLHQPVPLSQQQQPARMQSWSWPARIVSNESASDVSWATGEEFREIGSPALYQASDDRRKRDAPFECSTCSRTFTTRRRLQGHENRHWGSPTPFRCDVCFKSYAHDSSLFRHQRDKHGKPSSGANGSAGEGPAL